MEVFSKSFQAGVPDLSSLSLDLDQHMEDLGINIKIEDLDMFDAEGGVVADVVDVDSLPPTLGLFEFDRMTDLDLDTVLLPAVSPPGGGAEKRSSILDELDTKDKIRQDCMWSSGGHQHNPHTNTATTINSHNKLFRSGERGWPTAAHTIHNSINNSHHLHHNSTGAGSHNGIITAGQLSLTPPTSYIHQYAQYLDTPLVSDDDESSSSSCSSSGDDETIDVVSEWTAALLADQENRLPVLDHAVSSSSRDHCYFSGSSSSLAQGKTVAAATDSSLLTPPDSSEEDEDLQPSAAAAVRKHNQRALNDVDNDRLNRAVNSILSSSSSSSTTSSSRVSSNAKFTFKINIKSRSKRLDSHQYQLLQQHQQRQALKKARSSFQQPRRSTMTCLKSTNTLTGTTATSRAGPGGVVVVEEKPRHARDVHNHMERQRRTDLKNAFDQLKEQVPAIRDSDRVSKQMILDTAIQFCREVREREAGLRQTVRGLGDRNLLLRKKLAALRSAARHR